MSFVLLDHGVAAPRSFQTRIDVVKSTDSDRGFRLFDNAVFVVRDVASEELFLDRVRIAYGVFDIIVRPYMDTPLTTLARRLVLATRICISHYFNRQSIARTNRPFVVSAEYRDSPSLFCACSDFLRAYLYTKTADDLNVDSGVWTDGGSRLKTDEQQHRPQTTVKDFLKHLTKTTYAKSATGEIPTDDYEATKLEECRIQRLLGTLEARLMIAGGLASDLNVRNPDSVTFDTVTADTAADTSEKNTPSSKPEAILYVIADVAALTEFLCYMFYMTPVDLTSRYAVRTGCAAPTVRTDDMSQRAKTCCREKSERYNSSDTVRVAISEFIRRQNHTAATGLNLHSPLTGETVDSYENNNYVNVVTDPRLVEYMRDARQDAPTATRATRLQKRNDTLVKNLLLLLFDKSLSAIVDNGFDNANKRRRYGTDSKTVGGATIYTGILDTVGRVEVRYGEGTILHSSENTTLPPLHKDRFSHSRR